MTPAWTTNAGCGQSYTVISLGRQNSAASPWPTRLAAPALLHFHTKIHARPFFFLSTLRIGDLHMGQASSQQLDGAAEPEESPRT